MHTSQLSVDNAKAPYVMNVTSTMNHVLPVGKADLSLDPQS
jgi:hypothetical protein